MKNLNVLENLRLNHLSRWRQSLRTVTETMSSILDVLKFKCQKDISMNLITSI